MALLIPRHLLSEYVARNTVTEVALLTLPLLCGTGLGIVLSLLSLPITLLIVSAWFGLVLGIWTGRSTVFGYAPLAWPRPETAGDNVIAALAYNGVLSLGVLLAAVVWSATDRLLLAGAIAAVGPLWFLKHVHLFVVQFE